MKVVVVGAGFAGLAAAVALIERRHEVTLLERRGVLGGRATSFRDAWSGSEVDNGTHLMIGAYADTLDLIRRAGAGAWLWEQDDLRLDWIDAQGVTSLSCPPLPAPLHLFAGLLGLRLPWRVRVQALRLGWQVRFGAQPEGLTLAEYLSRAGQGAEARRLLWDPLATAMLNETPERAAAVLFRRVFQEAFLRSRRASRLVFLRCGWGRLHERLADYFQRRGGHLRRRALAEALELDGPRVRGVRLTQRAESREALRAGVRPRGELLEADAVVAAVPWGALPGLLPAEWRARTPFVELGRFQAAPIVSVDLWLDRAVPAPLMLGFREGEMEWMFDKGRLFGRAGVPQHLSFVISAAHRAHPRPNAELVAAAQAALRRHFPAAAEARVTHSLVLREAAATFSADPATECLRPGNVTPLAGLYLAGDWTNTGLPATIEGAVRSGRAAAAALERA